MAEIGISTARCLFCFDQFIKDVENEKAELQSSLESVKKRAEEATKRTEEITQPVKKWVNDVENILQEVQRLQEKVEGGRNNCFHVSFRYSLAKDIAEKTKKMMKLNNNKNFEPFSHLIQYFKDFIYFNSTKSAYEQILKAIKDDKSKMIGLYGIGGSGKTTLAKEVGKKVQELKVFDKVIMAVVFQPLNIKNVQDQIADQLGLMFEKQSIPGRAQRLSQRLRNEKILIILDDVWGYLNLEDIGIPSSDNKGCCVLLTTRLRSVCSSMDCQSTIELSLLTGEEAWALFELHADITDESPNELKGVARKIADECKGLPITIVTVGSTLKGKSFVEWTSALLRLNPVAKSLFLLCSMFPEDHNISKEDLVRLGKGIIELVETVDTMEEAREQIYVGINVLLDSCLLMPSDDKECVKMHDRFRDVALSIASKEGQAIVVDRQEIPRKLIENETIKDTEVISLWDIEENVKFFDKLHCPTLKILLLHSKISITEPNAYLGGMEALKVLALIRFRFKWDFQWATTWSMPQSIESLTNLRTLCLRGNVLGDISILGSLKGLEILDLRRSSFDELPIGIVDMNKLKLLDLFGCSIKKSPYDVIERCSQLQELYIWTPVHRYPQNVSFPSLRRYTLCFFSSCKEYIFSGSFYREVEASIRGLWIEKLNISELGSSMKDHFVRADLIYLENCSGDHLDFSSNIKILRLHSFSNIKFLVDVNILQTEQVFSNLVTLSLNHMFGLEQVFRDSSINCPLQNLEELLIDDCPQLYDISFPRNSNMWSLKTLCLHNCPMLNSALFTSSIAQTLVLLEKLHIRNCMNLKHIVVEHEEDGNANSKSNQDLSLVAFQNLRVVSVDGCDKLGSIMPLLFAFSLARLESLKVRFNSELKYVFGGGKENTASMYERNEIDESMEIGIGMPVLQDINLTSLPNLIGLFPQNRGPTTTESNIVWVVTTSFNRQDHQALLPQPLQAFLNLKELTMDEVQSFEGIFELQVKEVVDDDPIKEEATLKLNSDLSSVELSRLPELKFIWKGPTQILTLQRLARVSLSNCPKLKTIFTSTIVTSLPELRSLKVRFCRELEGILFADSERWVTNLYASSQNICFPKLFEIEIGGCNKLKCLFSYSLACHCPSVEKARIEDCSELEGVVESDEGGGSVVDGHGERVLFPKLNNLTLTDLPRLTKIFPGFKYNSSLHFIQDCPKYTVSSTST